MGTREKIDRKKRLKKMLGLTDEGMTIFNDALHEVAVKEKKKKYNKKYKQYERTETCKEIFGG